MVKENFESFLESDAGHRNYEKKNSSPTTLYKLSPSKQDITLENAAQSLIRRRRTFL
jgi:hypothetical protein